MHSRKRKARRVGQPPQLSASRRLLIESLEQRELFAINPVTIVLNGGNGINLLGGNGGGQLQNIVRQGNTSGSTINTGNVIGLNNIAPIAGNDSFSTSASSSLSGNLLGSNGAVADHDPDGDAISVQWINQTPGNTGTNMVLASGAMLRVESNGTMFYDPGTAFRSLSAGTSVFDTFTYRLLDARGGFSTGTVSIAVTGVNEQPQADNDALSVGEDAPPTNLNLQLLDGDSDPDNGETSQLRISGVNASGMVGALNLINGVVTYSPNGMFESLLAGQSTTESFVYSIEDPAGAGASATAIVTIQGANDAPSADDDSMTIPEDATSTEITTVLLTGDTDKDLGQTATLVVDSIITTGTRGIASLSSNRVFYRPGTAFDYLPVGQSAVDKLVYRVRDVAGLTSVATVTITVTGTNDAPTADDDTPVVGENDAAVNVTPTLLVGDNDPDESETAQLLITTVDATGTIGIATVASGVVNYNPNGNFEYLRLGQTASDYFKYTIVDPHGESSTGTATVSIIGANDAPIADDDLVQLSEDNGATEITAALLTGDSDVDTGETASLEISAIDSQNSLGIVQLSGGRVYYQPGALFQSLPVSAVAQDQFRYTIRDSFGATSTATVTVSVTGVNDLPTASDDTLIFTEDESQRDITQSALANDTDIDVGEASALSIISVDTTGTIGTVSLSSGVLRYNPGTAWNQLGAGSTGTTTFRYTISDPNGANHSATVTILVAGLNDSPTADDDSATTAENDAALPLTTLMLTGDVDPDTAPQDSLTIASVNTTGTRGVVTLASGNVTYSSDNRFESLAVGQTTTDTFVYTIVDSSGASAVATVTMTVQGRNDFPSAINDSYTAQADTLLTVAVAGVLSNDTDPDSGETASLAISTAAASSAAGATVSVSSDGSFSYDPRNITAFAELPLGTNASDFFTYTVTDIHGAVSTATAVITVQGINNAPNPDDDAITVLEDAGSTDLTNILLNGDSDPDLGEASQLTITSVQALSVSGSLSLVNGHVLYNAASGWQSLGVGGTGTDTFTYTVSDPGGAVATATVTITIQGENDAVSADNDSLNIAEDAGATDITSTLLAGDTDIDSTPSPTLLIVAVHATGTVGVVTLFNGTVSYNPNGAWNHLGSSGSGTDSFTYTLSDQNGSTSVGTVTVTVNGSNDAPSADNDAHTMFANAAVVSVTNILLTGDHDPDSVPPDTLTISAIGTSGTLGQASLSSGAVTYGPNGAFTALPQGSVATDTFTYTVTDGGGLSATATMTVSILGINDVPIADNDSASVGEDAAATDLTSIVLTGDSDPDTGETAALYVSSFDSQGTVGTVSLVGSSLKYNPNGMFHSLGVGSSTTDTFKYRIRDPFNASATGTVTVTITGANDVPVAGNDSVSISEDAGATSLTLSSNDSDVDAGDTLTITAVGTSGTLGSVSLASGVVSYNPNGAFESLGTGGTTTDTFTYTVSDGHGGTATATVTVTISGQNDAPTAANDAFGRTEESGSTNITALLLANDSDPDTNPSDTLTLVSVTPVSMLGSVSLTTGIVTYNTQGAFNSLSSNATAVETFTYTLRDNSLVQRTATVTITIQGQNDSPTADNDTTTVNEDNSYTDITSTLLNGDTDPDTVNPDTLVIIAVQSTSTIGKVRVTNGVVEYSPDGKFEILAVGESAVDTFTYTLSDGQGGTSTATVSVTINGQNDAPQEIGVFLDGVPPNSASGVRVGEVLAYDLDSTDSHSYTLVSGTGSTDNSSFQIVFQNGIYDLVTATSLGAGPTWSVRIEAVDSQGATIQQAVTIYANHAPVISLDGDNSSGTAPNVSHNFSEGSSSIILVDGNGTGLTISDADDTNLEYARVELWGNSLQTGQESLSIDSALVTSFGLNTTVSQNGQLIEVLGPGTLAQYRQALETVRYANTSSNVTATQRTVIFQVSDGHTDSNRPEAVIQLIPFNDSPAIDLDADNSTDTGTDFAVTFIEPIPGDSGTGNVVVADVDFSISDIDSTTLSSAVITVTDHVAADAFAIPSSNASITVTTSQSGTDYMVMLTGIATLSEYRSKIREFRYGFSNELLVNQTRLITVRVNDGGANSNTATATVTLQGRNDPPTVSLDLGNGGLYSTVFFEANNTSASAPTYIADSTVTIYDGDSTTISDAYVQLTNPVDGAAETLVVNTAGLPSGISVHASSTAFQIRLTGNASISDYQTALRQITYVNTHDAPNTNTVRTVTVAVSDGSAIGPAGTAHIAVFETNDDPISDNDTLTISEDASLTNITATLLDGDTDRDPGETATLVVNGLNTVATQGTAQLTSVVVSYSPGAAFQHLKAGQTATDFFYYRIQDVRGGQTILGDKGIDITVTGANDAPVASMDQYSWPEELASGLINNPILNDSDPDTGETFSLALVGITPATGTLGSISQSNGNFTYATGGNFDYLSAGQTIDDFFTYQVRDINNAVSTGTIQISIVGANDAPTGVSLSSPIVPAEEGNLNVVGTFTTADPDTADTHSYSFLMGAGDSGNALFTISGNQLIASTNINYTSGPISIRVLSTDNHGLSIVQILSLTTAYRPVINLDADNSGTHQPDWHGSFTEGSSGTPITGGAVITDNAIDPDVINGATVVLTNAQNGTAEYLTIGSSPFVTVTSSNSGRTLTLSGNASRSHYASLLDSIQYHNSSFFPSETPARSITVQVTDGQLQSAVATALITVNGVDTPSTISPSTGNRTSDNGASTQLMASATIADPDSPLLSKLRITLDSLPNSSDEVLAVNVGSSGLNVSGLSNGIEVTGSATIATYQSILRSLTYANTAGALIGGNRVVSISVYDGTVVSNTAQLNLFVNAPVQIDLDADNSTDSGNDYLSTGFIEPIAGDNGSGPVSIADTDLLLSDSGGSLPSQMVITVTNSTDSGAEFLTVTGSLPSGITVDPSSTATNLILVGSASVSAYQTAIGQITYNNVSQSPSTQDRLITVRVHSGSVAGNIVTATIPVVSRNDAPVPADDSFVFHEDETSRVINVSANDSDPDGPSALSVSSVTQPSLGSVTLASGNVSFNPNGAMENLAAGQSMTVSFSYTTTDSLLSRTASVTITVNGRNDAPTNITASSLTVDPSDGVGTPVAVLGAIDVDNGDSHTFTLATGDGDDQNSMFTIVGNQLRIASSLPIQPSYSVRVRATDSQGSTYEKSFVINAAFRPVLSLDENNSLGHAPHLSFTFNEGSAPAAIHDGMSLTDLDSASLAFAEVTLNGAVDGSESIVFSSTLPSGVTLDGASNATFLRITGSAPVAAYKAALESIRYAHISQRPTDGARTATIRVSDGTSLSTPVTATIQVVEINDPPVLNAGSSATLSYTNNSAALAVLSGLTITDADDSQLSGAVIQVNSGFVSGQDLLLFTDQNGIHGSYNGSNGTLTLTGNASVANYQAALRSIQFDNPSEPVTSGTRTIRFTVTDRGIDQSNAVSRSILVNNQTILSLDADNSGSNAPGFNASFTEGGSLRILSDGISITDAAHNNLVSASITLSNQQDGTDEYLAVDEALATSVGISVTVDSNSHSITLAGTASLNQYRQVLESVHYFNASRNPSITTRTVTFVVNNGEVDSASRTASIAITAVNTPPVARSGRLLELVNSGLISSGFASNPSALLITADDTMIATQSSQAETIAIMLTASEELAPPVTVTAGGSSDFSPSYSAASHTAYFAIPLSDQVVVIDNSGLSPVTIQTLTNEVNGVSGLDGAAATAISPDERHIYVASAVEDSVAVFTRNPANGQLTYVTKYQNGSGGVANLADPRRVLISPDGRNVYVISKSDERIGVFQRNAVNGRLTFVTSLVANGGVTSASILSAAMSQDGKHLYCVTDENSLSVFSRNSTTGALTLTQTLVNGSAGISGLIDSESIFVSPDGRHVFAVSQFSNSLISFRRDETTGALTFLTRLDDTTAGSLEQATQGAISANGNLLITLGGGGSPLFGQFEPTGYSRTFIENSTAISVFGGSNGVVLADDSGVLTSMSVAIVSAPDGNDEVLSWSTSGTPLNATPGTGNRSVTISGNGTIAQYQQVLNSITYRNNSDNPTTTSRSIRVTLQDGSASGQLDVAISITALDDPPTLTGIEGSTLAYTENDLPTAITSTITVVDPDGPNLTGALVAISSGYHNGQDVLGFAGTAPSGITVGAFDAATGTLQLSGSASTAAYQAALRSITFFNTSDQPDTSARTVSYMVTSGAVVSSVASRSVSVATANNHPVLTLDTVSFQSEFIDNQGETLKLSLTNFAISSPDGRHVAASSSSDASISVFERDPADGRLTFVTQYQNGTHGISKLGLVGRMSFSPDGAYLYAVASGDNSLTIFSRNSLTGELSLVSEMTQGAGGISGLSNASHVVMDPSGSHAYVVISNGISVWSRNSVNGTLTLIETLTLTGSHNDAVMASDGKNLVVTSSDGKLHTLNRNTVTGALTYGAQITGIGSLSSVKVSHDNKNVYVADYFGNRVRVYARNTSTGALTAVQQFSLSYTYGPSGIVVSPDDSTVVVNGLDSGRMFILRRNTDNGFLTLLDTFDTSDRANGVGQSSSPIFAPTGDDLYIPNVDLSRLMTFQVVSRAVYQIPNSPAVSVFGSSPGIAVFDSEGTLSGATIAISNHVSTSEELAVNTSGTSISAQFDANTGTMTLSGSDTTAHYQQVLRTLTYRFPGNINTVLDQRVLTITVNDGTTASNSFRALVSISGIPSLDLDGSQSGTGYSSSFTEADSSGSGTLSAAIADSDLQLLSGGSPMTGLLVGFTASGDDNERLTFYGSLPSGITLAVAQANQLFFSGSASTSAYSRVLQSIRLLNEDETPTEGDRLVTVSAINAPYVAIPATATITVNARNDGPSILTSRYGAYQVFTDDQGVDGLLNVSGSAVSPDGRFVYAAGTGESEVAVFARNYATGELTFQSIVSGSSPGFSGLNNPRTLIISPDGNYLFVHAGNTVGNIALFRRDNASGALTFLQNLVYGSDGISGIDPQSRFAISPSGDHLIVSAPTLDKLTVYAIRPGTGMLSRVQELLDDGRSGGTVNGLDNPKQISISPDGKSVYVVSELDNALVAFTRDTATGLLTYQATFRDGTGGVDGLFSPEAVVISPDGRFVYSADAPNTQVAMTGERISIFSRNVSTGALTFSSSLPADDGIISLALVNTRLVAFAEHDNLARTYTHDSFSGSLTALDVFDSVDFAGGIGSAKDVRTIPSSSGFGGQEIFVADGELNRLVVMSRAAKTVTFHENSGGAVVFAGDSDLSISDPEGQNLSSLTAQLSNRPNGSSESLSVNVGSTGLNATYNSTTGVLTINGNAPASTYASVLTSLIYNNTASPLNTTDRLLFITAQDTAGTSGLRFNVRIAINPGPVINVDRTGAIAFTENGSAVTIPGSSATITESNSAMTSLVVSFTTSPDLYEFLSVNTNGTSLTSAYDSNAGLLTISGSQSPAVYQQVLRTLRYQNISDNPSGTRVIRITGNDGAATSTASATVSVTAVNDAPSLTVLQPAFVSDAASSSTDQGNHQVFRHLVSSPDGKHLYSHDIDGNITVFSRNTVTGVISYSSSANINPNANNIAISPDGSHVYATSASGTLSAYSRNAVSGALTRVSTVNAGTAYALVIDATGQFVTVAVHNALAVYSRNATTGALSLQSTVPGYHFEYQQLLISRDNATLYAVHPFTGVTIAYSRNTSTGELNQVQLFAADVTGSAVLSPDDRQFYAVDGNTQQRLVYDRNAVTGALTQSTGVTFEQGGDYNLTMTTDGRLVVMADYSQAQLVTYSRDLRTGLLSYVGIVPFSSSYQVNQLDYPSAITVSPNGYDIYVASDSYPTIAHYSRAAVRLEWGESDAPLAVFPSINVIDDDAANLTGATISMTGLINGVGESLSYSTAGTNITVSVSNSTQSKTITLSGNDTPAHYQSVLRSMQYSNPAGNVRSGLRKITLSVSDGTTSGNSFVSYVQVTGTNDAAILNLGDGTVTFDPNLGATPLGGVNGLGTSFGVQDEELEALFDYGGATLSLQRSTANAQDVWGFQDGNNFTKVGNEIRLSGFHVATFDTSEPGKLFLSFISNPPYLYGNSIDQLLRQITYSNTTSTFSTFSIGGIFYDGNTTGIQGDGGARTTLFLFDVVVDKRPTINLVTNTASVAENSLATGIVSASATISDVDSANLSSLTVSISDPQIHEEYLFAEVGSSGLTSTYDSVNGLLTVSGSASVATYQSVLRSVRYLNLSDAPTTSRSLTWVVNDGNINSDPATLTVSVTPVNDVPFARSQGMRLSDWKDGRVIGLNKPMSSAVSPDGSAVYVVSESSGTLTAFDLDVQTGTMTFGSKTTALSQPRSVAVSSDSAYVYVLGVDYLYVLQRSQSSPTLLTLQQTLDVGLLESQGTSPRSVVLSGDGANVYVTDDGFVHVYSRNGSTGLLTHLQTIDGDTVSGLILANSLAVSPNGNRVYVGGNGIGNVTIFTRAGNGSLTFFGTSFLPNVGIIQNIVVAPGDRDIYFTTEDGIWLAQNTNPSALLSVGTSVAATEGKTALTLSSDGTRLFAASTHHLYEYSRNTTTGALVLTNTLDDFGGNPDGLYATHSLSIDPTDSALFVTGTAENKFSMISITSGMVQREQFRQSDSEWTTADAVSVSSDGTGVYVSDTSGSKVFALQRDATTGTLAVVGSYAATNSRRIAISPNGANLYSAGSDLRVFSRNSTTSALTSVQTQVLGSPGSNALMDVVVSPTGSHVYAITQGASNAVWTYSRNASTGQLTFVESDVQGVGGVTGMLNAQRIAISPDGNSVYIGTDDGNVTLFSRNAANGSLTFVEVISSAESQSLQSVKDLVISPDARYLYAATGRGLVRFDRNIYTGKLSGGSIVYAFSLIGTPTSVDITPDGKSLYLGSQSRLLKFERILSTGILSLRDSEIDGSNGNFKIDGLKDLAISPDGLDVFAASDLSAALSLYSSRSMASYGVGDIGFTVLDDGDTFLLTDVDSATVTSATVVITGADEDYWDTLSVNTSGTGITATYTPTTYTLTLSGNRSASTYQTVLRSLTYYTIAPEVTTRQLRVVVNDSSGSSSTFLIAIELRDSGDPLVAAPGAGPGASVNRLPDPLDSTTTTVLGSTIEISKLLWEKSGQLTAQQLATLREVTYSVADLQGAFLGMAVGSHIYLDRDAAGWGWFIDTTPASNEEFEPGLHSNELVAKGNSKAEDRVDLLTVVLHEMGHVLGKDHDEIVDSLMYSSLDLGTRKPIDSIWGDTDWHKLDEH